MNKTSTKTFSKLEAATALLEGALQMFDQGDHLSSIVLAGAAEDLLQGQLIRGNRASLASRAQLAMATVALTTHFNPSDKPPEQREAFDMMRDVYNWLRHDDRGDALERRLDWRQEAVHVCMRAIDNYYQVTGTEHPGAAMLGYPISKN